jgi:hypothetical protein
MMISIGNAMFSLFLDCGFLIIEMHLTDFQTFFAADKLHMQQRLQSNMSVMTV